MQNGTNGLKPNMNIVIVGGSLGGLGVGIALKRIGYNTTILERNPTPLLHNQGAGIVAGGDTLRFFKTYNRCPRELAVQSERRQYFNKEGNIVHKEDMIQSMTSWDLAYYLLRANYDGVKSEYCELPDPIYQKGEGETQHLHGHKVTDIMEEGTGVRVFFETTDGSKGDLFADMVVAADGPSSSIRAKFEPNVERTYAGYCALRGTVPENEASDATRQAFCNRFAFFHAPGIQILAYLIPGQNGSLEPGSRLINFVYYTNFPTDSSVSSPNANPTPFTRLMTDSSGTFHRITLPPGKMSPEVWEQQKQVAVEKLPPQFAELVCRTKTPFAQAITDVRANKNEHWNGKVVLVGDALFGFRPHTVASTSQAEFNAMSLAAYLNHEISREQWIRETMMFGRLIQNRGVEMGNRSQFGGGKEGLPLEDHIHDRNIASTPREKEVFPDWTCEDLPSLR